MNLLTFKNAFSEVHSPFMISLFSVTKDEFISKSGEWILANINCTGYYRVNYNPENWERLLTQLETNPQVSTGPKEMTKPVFTRQSVAPEDFAPEGLEDWQIK